MDNLITCPCCGSDACYHSLNEEGKFTKMCMTCGFTTGDQMIEGDQYVTNVLENTAQLVKDLSQPHEGYVWYPIVINIPDKGMIFPEWNKRVKDWYWASVRSKEVLEEEKNKYPNPQIPGEYHKYRVDMETLARYDKYEFMDALEYIGIINNE